MSLSLSRQLVLRSPGVFFTWPLLESHSRCSTLFHARLGSSRIFFRPTNRPLSPPTRINHARLDEIPIVRRGKKSVALRLDIHGRAPAEIQKITRNLQTIYRL